MREPRWNGFTGWETEKKSRICRVLGNFRLAFSPVRLTCDSANGAPLHAARVEPRRGTGQAQAISALAHAGIVAVLAVLAMGFQHNGTSITNAVKRGGEIILRYSPPKESSVTATPSPGMNGGSGDQSNTPATRGRFAPLSSMPLAPPRLNQNRDVSLPVAAAIFDAQAPANVARVEHLGIPWMKEENDSAGPGKKNGIGSGDKNGMGDSDGDGEGAGPHGSGYANAVTQPACSYCPDPAYSEEARKEKLQGTVTLSVLVGADGRAHRIRMIKTLGSGLDEKAVEALQGWKFIPARDAGRREVPAWVTVEAVFRLF